MSLPISTQAHTHVGEPRLVDADLDARLQRDGYAVIRVVAAEEAQAIAEKIAALYGGETHPNLFDANWFFGLVDENRDRVVQSSTIIWNALVPHLSGLFADAKCQFTSVAIKPAGAAATPMHQHWPTTAIPFVRRITCWALLSQSGAGPGTFRLVPRSHQILPFVRYPEETDYFHSFSDRINAHYAVDVTLQPGEAILFEDSIIHGTSANPTAHDRISGLVNFIGAGMGSAIILPQNDKTFSIIDTDGKSSMSDYLQTGQWPASWKVIGTIPNRNRPVNEVEFKALLAMDRKASLNFDPLDLVRKASEHTYYSAASSPLTPANHPGLIGRIARRVLRVVQ